jgi:hypothetical protein
MVSSFRGVFKGKMRCPAAPEESETSFARFFEQLAHVTHLMDMVSDGLRECKHTCKRVNTCCEMCSRGDGDGGECGTALTWTAF